MKDIIVISLGGSVVVPDEIDASFLKRFREFVLKHSEKYRFILVIGGGKTARRYQDAYKEVMDDDPEVLDWIGVSATHLNAFLVKLILHDISEDEVVQDMESDIEFEKDVLVAGGWKPGWTTDYDAVLLAERFDSKVVINMTNVDYLYDKNPSEYPDAKKIEETDWQGFTEIVGEKHRPGANVPFDPVATKKAASLGLKLVLLGKDLENLDDFLSGRNFKGSVIE